METQVETIQVYIPAVVEWVDVKNFFPSAVRGEYSVQEGFPFPRDLMTYYKYEVSKEDYDKSSTLFRRAFMMPVIEEQVVRTFRGSA